MRPRLKRCGYDGPARHGRGGMTALTADEIDALTHAYGADADMSWRDSLREEVDDDLAPVRPRPIAAEQQNQHQHQHDKA